MSILYLEPFSGISGDMLLGALCGLKGDYDTISKLPKKLNLNDAKVEVNVVRKNGINCKHVKVVDLGGKESSHHRKLKEILEIIEKGNISDRAKEIARQIFTIIGESESRIHNIPLDEIHFHELSGVDSIIDIVGCAQLIDELNIKKTYSDPICTGYGSVKTQHGILPVPAPATADILRGLPTYKGNEEGERVTPTGAAILKFLDPNFDIPIYSVEKIAYGPGEKDFKGPNVLRANLIEVTDTEQSDQIYVIESNLDDVSAELLGNDFQKELFQAGAIDFYFTSVQMKKGRPGQKISVLTDKKNINNVSNYIMEHTTSIGVRFYPVSRNILERNQYELDTKYGKIKVKEVLRPSGSRQIKIEHNSLKELSNKTGKSIPQLEYELMHLITPKS
ncbi:MAG: nickel pincer cofactor biosynthesis protein LarC [Eudoraea sp.]|nr:nickel pincer cofactor biosynthesis protein LarC [Eudoraea sp.]